MGGHATHVQCPSGSVGAIFKNQKGQFLVLYRKAFPPGLAAIAGHTDPGETSEQALIREVREESGLEVEAATLVFHGVVENPCKLGFASHEWWVYEVTTWRGEPELKEPDKHVFVRWMSVPEIRSYVDRKDADPVWADVFFPKLILNP